MQPNVVAVERRDAEERVGDRQHAEGDTTKIDPHQPPAIVHRGGKVQRREQTPKAEEDRQARRRDVHREHRREQAVVLRKRDDGRIDRRRRRDRREKSEAAREEREHAENASEKRCGHEPFPSASTLRSSSWIRPFEARIDPASTAEGAPSMRVTVPPASRTINVPAATSHGFKSNSQNPSNRPQAVYARSSAADPSRRTACA